EHRVIVCGLHVRELDGVRQLALRRCILFETSHRGCLILWKITLGIDGRLAAFRRGERQRDASVSEYEVRRRKLFEPEASLSARVPELIMRRQHHQDLHVPSLSFASLSCNFCSWLSRQFLVCEHQSLTYAANTGGRDHNMREITEEELVWVELRGCSDRRIH